MATELEFERLSQITQEARKPHSQRTFADLIGVTMTTVQNWENKVFFPRDDKLSKLAQYMGWTLEEMHRFIKLGKRPTVNETLNRLLDYISHLQEPEILTIQYKCLDRLTELNEIRYPDRLTVHT